MAAKTCPKCGAVVSRLVRMCPHCGAKIAAGTGTEIGLVLGLLVLAGAVVLVVKASNTGQKPGGSTQTVPLVQQQTPPPPPPPAPPPPAPVVEAPPPEPVVQVRPLLAKGMTMEAVEQLWGKPAHESHAQAANIRTDWWTYSDGTKLRFVNSILDSWAKGELPVASALPGPAMPPGEAAASAGPTSLDEQTYGQLKVALKRAEIEDTATGRSSGQRSLREQTLTAEVRARFGITEAKQKAILAEGDAKHWPLPPVVFGPQLSGPPVTIGRTYTTGMTLELLIGRNAPVEGVQSADVLPPGTVVHVLTSAPMSGITWFYVEVIGVGTQGWIPGLSVLTATPADKDSSVPAGLR